VSLRARLTAFAVASIVVALALGITVLWAASVAGSVLSWRQLARDRAESCQTLTLAAGGLLLGSGGGEDQAERARSQLDRMARLFGPGEGGEEVEQLRQVVEQAARARRAGAAPSTAAVDWQREVSDRIGRLEARTRLLDTAASRVTSGTIHRAIVFSGVLIVLVLLIALVGAWSVLPRLRRGLAALEAGAARLRGGDLAARIGLAGTDELSSLGSAFDAMAATLRGTMLSKEEAEALVRDRTAELEQARKDLGARLAQLETVHIELDAAERLVAADRLARGLTHEINNPLAVLLANVEFAFEELGVRAAGSPVAGEVPDEALTALDEARQAGRRISLIVRELMSFSRDRTAGDLGTTDLAEVLDRAQRTVGPEIRRHARFDVELPPGPLLVQGHPAHLLQAFLELLFGAAAAAAGAERAGNLVSLRLLPDAGGAVVEVRDTGAPIPEDLRFRLFDPFFKTASGSVAGEAGLRGAGLGLAACYRIIRAAGGRLEVESTAESGTTFRVWLPAASTRSRVALRTQAAPRAAARARLLVVDADPFDCATTYRVLFRDFDVAPHTRVASALAILRAGERFDLILCSPESGPALGKALADDGSIKVASLVVLLGDGGAPGAPDPARPAWDRLEKPVSVARVADLLRGRGAGGAAPVN
jgi:signal transduction histidine kinase